MSISLPVLVALGPCLIMGMATLALYTVHRRFSSTRHALTWTFACAAGMLCWGLIAFQGMLGRPPLHGGPAADALGLGSVLLLAEGFRVRAETAILPGVVLAAGALTLAVEGALFLAPPMPIGGAVIPLVSTGLFVWMALMVRRPAAPIAATDLMVIASLLTVALVHALCAALAIGEQVGLVRTHVAYQTIYSVAAEPMAAAIALLTLMLIAFDFSVELKRLVHTDPLTGVLNREGFEHAARLALHRGKRRPLAVVIADIDRFKEVNDRHGHLAGDRALSCVARHLADRLGRDGTVARVGGEEFALLMPGFDDRRAFARIDALRASLAEIRIEGELDIPISASFGVAQRAPGEPLAAIMERADAALYLSKREGRNRTTLAAWTPDTV